MKVISINNSNTNTNSIDINAYGTINQILENPAVKAFFSEVSPRDIVTINGNDTSAIAGDIGNIEVDDDTVIEVAKFGEAHEQPRQAVTGHVFVSVAGGIASKKVLITVGSTTVKQVLTEKLANALASTQAQLQAMNIFVNDAAAGLCTTLKDGDTVVLESRKAGTKGCTFTVIDAHGETREFDLDPEQENSLEEYLDLILEDEVEDGFYSITRVDGQDFEALSGRFQEHVLMSPAADFSEVNIGEAFLSAEEEEAEEEEFTADGTVAPVQMGSVIVTQAGSCESIRLAITGRVTVKDAVTSAKVLNKLAMTADQILAMQFSVNDHTVDSNAILKDQDVVVISARTCGTKGC